MAHLMAMNIMSRGSGLPEERIVNTFHFATALPAATDLDYADARNLVRQFFQASVPVGGINIAIGNFIPHIVNRTAEIRVYNMEDPMPRPPRLVDTYTLPAAPSTGVLFMPAEVALVLSYRAAPVAGVPAARLRGRLYIGPISHTGANVAMTVADGGDQRPTSTIRDCLALKAAELANYNPAPPDPPRWSVFSRTSSQLRPVVAGFIDNSFDTQRRRGQAPTTRTTWTATST